MVRQRQIELVIHAGPRNDLQHNTGSSEAVRQAELRLLWAECISDKCILFEQGCNKHCHTQKVC